MPNLPSPTLHDFLQTRSVHCSLPNRHLQVLQSSLIVCPCFASILSRVVTITNYCYYGGNHGGHGGYYGGNHSN